MIYQFATVITNIILFIQCIAMAIYLHMHQTSGILLSWPAVFFLLSALGFLIGVLFHGVYNSQRNVGGKICAFFIMSLGGATSICLGIIAGKILFNGISTPIWDLFWFLLFAIFLAYCLYAFVKYGGLPFFYTIFLAIPAVLVFIYILPYAYSRTGNRAYLWLLSGLLILTLASVQQKMKIAVDPVRFDHNAVYHVICMVAFAVMFLGFKGMI